MQKVSNSRQKNLVYQKPLVKVNQKMFGGIKKCESCHNMHESVEHMLNAQFECINCSLMLCKDCMDLHLG
jgi:hypothetical protein